MEACEGCGFVWESVGDAEISGRIVTGAGAIAALLRQNPADAARRPGPGLQQSGRWSPLEYGGHVRDVLLHVRDRLIIGLVEDNPEFKPLYREQRVDMGLYAADTAVVVADELNMAAALFARTFAAIPADQLDRPCQYAYPTATTRSLRWMGQQVVHEIEHHLGDIDTGAVYERTKRAFIATITALTHEQLQVRVPATPDWSVRDVLAHVTGLAADLNAQRLPEPDDAGGSAWANNHVTLRRERHVEEIITEWDREAPTFEAGLGLFGYEFGSHFVADLFTHYQDVRSALGLAPDRDERTVAVALDHYLGFIDEVLTNARWGTLEAITPNETWKLGVDHGSGAQVSADPFELLRALSARRSADQIRAMQWEGDADGLLVALQAGFTGGYSLPAIGLTEA